MRGALLKPAAAFPKNAPLLEVRDLTIVRDRTTILDGVNWRVERGEHWVILGANGSGKTSLLSALTGYLTPTDGDVAVLGQVFGESDWRELRRAIGIVSSAVRQMMPDHEEAEITVASGKWAMIDVWGEVSRADRAAARRILRMVECGHLAERRWEVLSQGERQRVLIGRALMAKPRLLILDEPCAGLDPVAREHFLGFLARLAGDPMAPAMLFVTHHVEEIVPGFTHGLLLRAGRVHRAGRLAEVMRGRDLAEVFGERVRLRRVNGRYGLEVVGARGWA